MADVALFLPGGSDRWSIRPHGVHLTIELRRSPISATPPPNGTSRAPCDVPMYGTARMRGFDLWGLMADEGIGTVANQIFVVGFTILMLWSVGLSVPIMLWNNWTLRRDVHRWLRRRGVRCPQDVAPSVVMVRGGVGIGGEGGRFQFQGARLTAAVITPSAFVMESQWPLLPWRRRLTIQQGTTLRYIDGRVADPKRRCLVASDPPEHLVSLLRTSGWALKEVPF